MKNLTLKKKPSFQSFQKCVKSFQTDLVVKFPPFQVRQERDSLSKAPRWVRKRFTDLIVEEERERDMQRAEQQEHNIGGIGFD